MILCFRCLGVLRCVSVLSLLMFDFPLLSFACLMLGVCIFRFGFLSVGSVCFFKSAYVRL